LPVIGRLIIYSSSGVAGISKLCGGGSIYISLMGLVFLLRDKQRDYYFKI
jgi:hypothetical protein